MTDKVTIQVMSGPEGPCISINDYRVSGPKPWGGGNLTAEYEADVSHILSAVGGVSLGKYRALEAKLQEVQAQLDHERTSGQ